MIRLEKKSKVLFQLDRTLIVTLPMLADKLSWKHVIEFLRSQNCISPGNTENVIIKTFSLQYEDVQEHHYLGDGTPLFKMVDTKMRTFPGPAYFNKKMGHRDAGRPITLPGNFTKEHPSFNRTRFGY